MVIKINNFRGDLTDNSARKEALVPSTDYPASVVSVLALFIRIVRVRTQNLNHSSTTILLIHIVRERYQSLVKSTWNALVDLILFDIMKFFWGADHTVFLSKE